MINMEKYKNKYLKYKKIYRTKKCEKNKRGENKKINPEFWKKI